MRAFRVGQDAIEQVDAARHALDQVVGHAAAHEIPRPVVGQLRGGVRHDLVGDLRRLADAQAADGVGLESQRDRGLDALGSQSRVHAALDDAELHLPGIGGERPRAPTAGSS